jgi:hypothetical protein
MQVVHYASDGWLLHKSSDDARKQLEQEKGEAEAATRFQAEMDRALREKVCAHRGLHARMCDMHDACRAACAAGTSM